MRTTIKPYVNPVTIRKRGLRTRTPYTHTEGVGLGAAPVGVSKKLPLGHPKPGAPSHADFSIFKRPIAPSNIGSAENTDNT